MPQQLTPAAETVTLYFREGSSDKVYTASLDAASGGWVVNFAYGRRGSTMNTGTKTNGPVPFDKAKKIYDKLVAEKIGKGYTPGEDGTVQHAIVSGATEARDTGIRVQLLNEASSEEKVQWLLEDAEMGMQEKMDGRRQVIRKTGNLSIQAINRKGQSVGVADTIASSALALQGNLTIDGEAVGDTLYAFDILEHQGRDVSRLSYQERHALLAGLLVNGDSDIRIVPLAVGTARKRKLFNAVKAGGGEGVVFKRLSAPHSPGRPASGGDQLKYKFYSTGSFIVSAINQKRSVALQVLTLSGVRTPIGNVTIPPNWAVPPVDAIVEVRYLYCFSGGSLYQPTYLGMRDDIDDTACTATQLKFKAPDEEDI